MSSRTIVVVEFTIPTVGKQRPSRVFCCGDTSLVGDDIVDVARNHPDLATPDGICALLVEQGYREVPDGDEVRTIAYAMARADDVVDVFPSPSDGSLVVRRMVQVHP